MVVPRMAFGHVLRSPHAHARILARNEKNATSQSHAPGVLAVVTGADWKPPWRPAHGVGQQKAATARPHISGLPGVVNQGSGALGSATMSRLLLPKRASGGPTFELIGPSNTIPAGESSRPRCIAGPRSQVGTIFPATSPLSIS